MPHAIDPDLLARFVDEAAIGNTIAGFADSATRDEQAMFRIVWTADAEFIIGEAPHQQSAKGVEDIIAMLRRLRAGKVFFVQFAVPGVIKLDGDEAMTRTFIHEAARGNSAPNTASVALQSVGIMIAHQPQAADWVWSLTGVLSSTDQPPRKASHTSESRAD